jgi:hypothetical protein
VLARPGTTLQPCAVRVMRHRSGGRAQFRQEKVAAPSCGGGRCGDAVGTLRRAVLGVNITPEHGKLPHVYNIMRMFGSSRSSSCYFQACSALQPKRACL